MSPAGTVMESLSTILTYLSNLTNNLCQSSQGNLIKLKKTYRFYIEKYFFRGVYNPLYKQSESVVESTEDFLSVS